MCEMWKAMDQQTQLLRLIVQKMEIQTESDDVDFDDHSSGAHGYRHDEQEVDRAKLFCSTSITQRKS